MTANDAPTAFSDPIITDDEALIAFEAASCAAERFALIDRLPPDQRRRVASRLLGPVEAEAEGDPHAP